MDKRLTANEAAKMLGVDGHTVRDWIEAGKLGGSIDDSGKRRRFWTTEDCVHAFAVNWSRTLDLARRRGKACRGIPKATAVRTAKTEAPAEQPKPKAKELFEANQRKASDNDRIDVLERQVRALFAEQGELRKRLDNAASRVDGLHRSIIPLHGLQSRLARLERIVRFNESQSDTMLSAVIDRLNEAPETLAERLAGALAFVLKKAFALGNS